MKKQKILIYCSIMLLVVSLFGCKKTTSFTVGKWNQNVFENSWLNMKFEVSTDWEIATDEEIKELIGVGAENLNIEGTSAEQLKAAIELKTIYAFMASQAGMSVALMYENLALTTGGTKFDESKYMDELSKILLQITNLQYKLGNKSTVQLAGKEFHMMDVSAYEGQLIQEYYVHRIDDFMVCIVVSYIPDAEAGKVDFIKNIKTLK